MGLRGFLRGVLLAAALALAAAGACAQARDPVRQVMDEMLGPSPARAFHFVEALRRLQRAQEADLLARYLLHAYVEELAGLPQEGFRTVETGIRIAAHLPPFEPRGGKLAARWNEQLQARLELVLPEAVAQPLPLAVVNRAAAPLALPAFRLARHGEPVLSCSAPRGEATIRLVPPGGWAAFECVGGITPAVLQEARTRPGLLVPLSDAMEDARTRHAMVETLAAPQRAELDRLVGAAGAAGAAPQAAAKARPSPPAAPPGPNTLVPRFWPDGVVARFVAVLALLGAYWLASRAIGNTFAAFLVWLGGTGWVVAYIAREPRLGSDWMAFAQGLAWLLLLGLPLAAAIALHAAAAIIEEIRTDPEGFERKARRALLGAAVALVLALFGILFAD